jgi:uncharacterized protein DUF1064
MTRWTESDLVALQARHVPIIAKVSKPRKYRNEPTMLDGISFDSKLEAKRYGELKLLELAGHISKLKVHEFFELSAHGHHVGHYVADFAYATPTEQLVMEDCKCHATKTTLYRWKKRHVKAQYGIDIREIT